MWKKEKDLETNPMVLTQQKLHDHVKGRRQYKLTLSQIIPCVPKMEGQVGNQVSLLEVHLNNLEPKEEKKKKKKKM